MSARALAPSELTVTFDPAELGFTDTSQVAAEAVGWIGQRQAEQAAHFGLGVDHPDYHVFVLGMPGSGRSSLMWTLMCELAAQRPAPPDLVCLHNFDDAQKPWVLRLATGQGGVLRDSLHALAERLRQPLAAAEIELHIAQLRDAMADKVLDAQLFDRYLTALAKAASQSAADCATYCAAHVLVHGDADGAPALRDDAPTQRSLFGSVDAQARNGMLESDFKQVRAGLLHRANGGYLLLQLRDLQRDEALWEMLRRFVRSGRAPFGQSAVAGLHATRPEPEAPQLNVKLVLVGSHDDYYELQEEDPELMRHFRAKVEFAEHFPADAATRRALGVFIGNRCAALGLPHFSASAVARLLLELQRDIDDQRRIGGNFSLLESLLVEAGHACEQRGAAIVELADVEAALAAKRMRHDDAERQQLDAIVSGELLIHTHGRVVGQINSLAQIDQGDYRWGLPVRITARAYAGDEGVLNIDREVEMTCPSHDKGVLILQGWLSATFAALTPLCLSGSLVFEQEYYGVEGDSASCAEVFALLSAISGVALPQGLGVTGALNQHGEVMPVGGINEKIEGWFRTCRALGLDGTQGVIIPARNRAHLLLDQEVRDAVARGEFHIHVIERVQDGIALMTGMPAGEPDATGRYPEETLLGRVQQMLEEYRRACDESGHQREHEHGKQG